MNTKKKFVLKIILLVIPLILVYGFPFYCLYVAGELVPLDTIVQRQQQNEDLLFGVAYHNPNPSYKVIGSQIIKPDILVLGTSRVLQFRSGYFNTGSHSFYNAGHGVDAIRDFLIFLEKLPKDDLPSLLITGLDQNFFNPKWDPFLTSVDSIDTHLNKSEYRALGSWKQVYGDFFDGKFSLTSPFQKESPNNKYYCLGLNAIMNGVGYRHDGSHRLGNQVQPYVLTDATKSQYRDGIDRFQHTTTISQPAMKELEKIQQFCSENKIHLVAFLPPFANEVYDLIGEIDGLSYILELPGHIEPMFASTNHTFFNFSDPQNCNSGDNEMLDDIHGSEVTYLRMTIHMAQEDPTFKQYTNFDQLNTMLENRISDYYVID